MLPRHIKPFILIVFILLPGTRPFSVFADQGSVGPDPLDASEFMKHFHDSVASGDSLEVASALADDVSIAEGGRVQTRAEYLSHHFRSDAAFLGSITRDPVSSVERISGNATVVVSTTRLHGSFRDRSIDMISVETAVLEHSEETWKIVSIHWSSGRQ